MGRGSYKIDQPRSWAEIAIPKKKKTKIPRYQKIKKKNPKYKKKSVTYGLTNQLMDRAGYRVTTCDLKV